MSEIVIDSNGLIWMATGVGAFSFDGTTFTQYTVADGLVNDNIFTVDEDADGNLWFGAFAFNEGVSMFDGTTFTTFTEIPDAVRKIKVHSDGTIYFGGATNGFTIYDGTTFTLYTEDDGLIENHIRGLDEDSNGNMVISTWGGVSVFNSILSVFEFDNTDFKISPNPASDYVQIETADFDIQKYAIYSILGTQITEVTIANELQSIDISALSKGVYLLQFTNDQNQHIVRKLIKE